MSGYVRAVNFVKNLVKGGSKTSPTISSTKINVGNLKKNQETLNKLKKTTDAYVTKAGSVDPSLKEALRKAGSKSLQKPNKILRRNEESKKMFKTVLPIVFRRTLRSIDKIVGWVMPMPEKQSDVGVLASDALASEVKNIYIDIMNTIQLLGEKKSFKPIFFWTPTIFSKNKLTEYEEQERNINVKYSEFFGFRRLNSIRKVTPKIEVINERR